MLILCVQAIGPIFGGALTTGFSWRAIFWFLTICAGTSSLSFLLFFKDTFRKERSLIFQGIIKRRLKEQSQSSTNFSGSGASTLDGDNGNNGPGEIEVQEIKITLADLNPVKPQLQILRRWNNVAILMASGMYKVAEVQFLWEVLMYFRYSIFLRIYADIHDLPNAECGLWVQRPQNRSCHTVLWIR